jgi:hypothetical protein
MTQRKFVAVNIYITREESSQINNLNFIPWKLEKEEQTKHKASRERKSLSTKYRKTEDKSGSTLFDPGHTIIICT